MQKGQMGLLDGNGTSLKRGVTEFQAFTKVSRVRSRSLMNRELGYEDHESETILRVVVDRYRT
jgi:hypothetical protein